MELYRQTWEQSQQKLHHYKRRCPEESSLYRIIYNYREEFEYRYEELFQQQYGYYSSRTRGATKREERFRALLENHFEPLEITNVDRKRPTQYRASWIKKVYEIDPLQSSKCGGKMKIKAFILNQKEISRICKNLALKEWRAPPPITSAGVRVDYSTEFQQ